MSTRRLRFPLLVIIPCLLALPSPLLPAMKQSAANPANSSSSSEEKAFARMDAFVVSKKYEKVESLIESIITQGTPPARAYFRLGRAYIDHDEWQRAADWLEKSLNAQEGNDQAHLLLGVAYRELKQPEQAEREFMKAVSLSPRSDVNAYFAGQQLLLDLKYEAALSYLYQAVKSNPRNASAYRALGTTQVHLGNYGLAEPYYRKAVEVLGGSAPSDPGPLLDLSFILLLGHDPAKVEEALELAKRAAKIQPSSGSAHYLVGKALMSQGRAKEAVPELVLAIRINPEDSKPHFQLALAYERLGEKEKARAERQALAKTKQRANQQGMASGSVLPNSPE
ncbi:MAG: tetratricopeptide repeat protein [Terriglobia bacterium]|jgi:tetratricopeptide (TPR) repeat protein